MKFLKLFRIKNKFFIFLSLIFLLTAFAWVFVRMPINITIKKSGSTITAEYGGKKLEKSIKTQVKGQNILALSIKKSKEFAFVGYLFPADKIKLNGQDMREIRNISLIETSYTDNLLGWLNYKRDGDFSSYVNFDDVGEKFEVVVQNQTDNFEILITTTGISSFSFKYDDLASVFIRPQWHHEYEMSVQGEKAFGGPIGLDLQHILRRASLLWIFGITMVFILLNMCLLLVYCFKLFDFTIRIVRKYYPKRLFASSLKRVFYPQVFFGIVVLLITSFHLLMSIDVATKALDSLPHTQDEVSYIFQAKLLKMGKIVLEDLPNSLKPFFYHEFIIDNKIRTGIYTLGAPMFFALGMLYGLPQIVNPIISALTLIILLFMIRKALGLLEAIIAGAFYATSFFTVMQSASYLSHSITQFFIVLTYFFYRYSKSRVFVGVGLGFVFITRPYDGFLMSAFIGISEIFLLGQKFSAKKGLLTKANTQVFQTLFKCLFAIFIGFLPFLLFQALHNHVVSGNFFKLPLNVYSPYSQIGFGQRGVEWGSDFTIPMALENTFFYLHSSFDSFFAIGLPLFFAFFAKSYKQNIRDTKVANRLIADMTTIFIIFVVGYFPYYANGSFYGPRYWYGAAFAVFTLVASGMVTVFRFFGQRLKSPSGWRIALIFCFLATIYANVRFLSNLPIRFKNYNGIGKVGSSIYQKPAIVMVDGKNVWQSYGAYFHKMSPSLDDDVIYAIDQGISPKNQSKVYDNEILKLYFPGRELQIEHIEK